MNKTLGFSPTRGKMRHTHTHTRGRRLRLAPSPSLNIKKGTERLPYRFLRGNIQESAILLLPEQARNATSRHPTGHDLQSLRLLFLPTLASLCCCRPGSPVQPTNKPSWEMGGRIEPLDQDQGRWGLKNLHCEAVKHVKVVRPLSCAPRHLNETPLEAFPGLCLCIEVGQVVLGLYHRQVL